MRKKFGGGGQGPATKNSPSPPLKNTSGKLLPARLVFLLQDLKFGGTQRQALELARLLNPERFRVEFWLLAAGDDLTPLARSYGIPLCRLFRRGQVGPVALTHLWRRLKTAPPDLLMLLTVVPNIWGRILGRLARLPLIVGNCRGGGAPRRQYERWLWPLADHILCNSTGLRDLLISRHGLPSARLSVIPNGVDGGFFRPPERPRSGAPRVLSVARMVPEKDHDTLIRAFRLAAAEHPEAELWLVGEGPRRGEIEQLARRLLPPERVRFCPGQADLRPLLQQASLLALSSRAEAFPNVVLEAMAAGLPVVATWVGGVPEMVIPGQTGWLAPPGNAPALAAALSQLLGDPETRRIFGQAGRERAVEKFSLERMGRRYEEVFQHLLSDGI